MESYILISNLNDFIFCPRSIYFHNLYNNYSVKNYHRAPQTKGRIAHETIDKNKFLNQYANLKGVRDPSEKIVNAIEKISSILTSIKSASLTNEQLLGLEGNASKIYFKAFFEEQNWQSRKPRAKIDELNVLLDIGYTFLFHFIEAHLRLYGFDVFTGVYHRLFYQRKSLVCDLVEPFRCIVDKTIRKAYNLKQFNNDDFLEKNHYYILNIKHNKKYTKVFFEDILEHKVEVFSYVQDYYRWFIKDKELKDFPRFFFNKEAESAYNKL